MWKLRSIFSFVSILLLCFSTSLVAAQGSGKWQTLKGEAPEVIARGGFSGIFPDSSLFAYGLAQQTGLDTVILWCDIQLTKDGFGLCFPDINLKDGSDIDELFPNRSNTYTVNGVSTKGWFPVDFTLDDMNLVNLTQNIDSRPPQFDFNQFQIRTIDDIANQQIPPRLWLNIQHDAFFSQHNLSMRAFVISTTRRMIIDYISSPEEGFLRSIASRFRTGPTKLVFRFMGPDDVDPSTNQTYGLLLSNLTLIRTFATGILVPKNYIWPADKSRYLLNTTSLVLDAHKAGLEVFASNFANDDASMPYDYSYDPVAEYLSYVDNGKFSVDGVLSDYPITPSATIDCYAHIGKNATVQANVLIISSEGSSGDYPGCTDKAYDKAVSDGVDILDCPVQMSNDGIPFCLGSINLKDKTNVIESDFKNLETTDTDLNITGGIFTFNLTWSQIQTLKPAIFNPYTNFTVFRNPKARNDGNLMQLSDFLAFANAAPSVSGVLIGIEHAAYLAEKQGLGVTDAVLDTLDKSGYNNQTSKKILIKSTDSAVLSKIKNITSSSKYEFVYSVEGDIGNILNSTILAIKKFANSVVISKRSVFPTHKAFLTNKTTDLVPKLQASNLTVYVEYFQNEYLSQAWDFFSDPYVEINQYVTGMGINGVVTDFPATSARYRKNRCLGYKNLPLYMTPVEPGGLYNLLLPGVLGPAEAPYHILNDTNVLQSPLPPVIKRPTTNNTIDNGSPPPSPPPPSGQPMLFASTMLSFVATVFAAIVLC